jgi:hypothetical protein
MEKAGVKPAGRPLAVFVESDDSGFAITPDATYDAITAFLDEKASTRDSFVEEYGNDIKDANDPNLQVNIYVLKMTHGRSFLRPASRI